jgi:hypothetical protein
LQQIDTAIYSSMQRTLEQPIILPEPKPKRCEQSQLF